MSYVIHEQITDDKIVYIHDCGGRIVKTPNNASPGDYMAMCEKCKQIFGPWKRHDDIPVSMMVTTPDYVKNLVQSRTQEGGLTWTTMT